MEGDSMPCKYQYDVTCSQTPSTVISTPARLHWLQTAVMQHVRLLPRATQQTAVVQVHQTEPHGGNSLPAQLNHALVNTLGLNLYWVCAAHLAHLEKTPLLPTLQSAGLCHLGFTLFIWRLFPYWKFCSALYVLDLINISQLKGFVFVVSPPCWL
jgi:hypothetical protein